MLGFGVFQVDDQRVCEKVVGEAIDSGYRLLDTAMTYNNEEALGRAVKNSGVDRTDFFITSKVWISDYGYDRTMEAFDKSLHNLGMDYLDLYLIHMPLGDYYGYDPLLLDIAKKHGKTTAQVMLRWNIQRGVIVIPKSVHKERIEQNFDVWDFSLDDVDMARIASLDRGKPTMLDVTSPSEIRRLYSYLGNPVLTTIK